MELNTIFTNVAVLRALITFLAALVLVGFSILITEKTIAAPLTRGLLWIISHKKQIIAQVDEPTDSIPVRLEKETGIPAAIWSNILTLGANAVISGAEAMPLMAQSAPMIEAVPMVEQDKYAGNR